MRFPSSVERNVLGFQHGFYEDVFKLASFSTLCLYKAGQMKVFCNLSSFI